MLLPSPAATQTCGNIDALGAGRATGKGSANDASALQRMDADTSTGLIYLPPGRYRIASTLTLRKPLFAESGAVLVVDGVTLTLLAQPEAPRVRLFEIRGACSCPGIRVVALAVGMMVAAAVLCLKPAPEAKWHANGYVSWQRWHSAAADPQRYLSRADVLTQSQQC